MTEYSGPFESSGAGLQEADWLVLEDQVFPNSGYVKGYLNELAVSQHSPNPLMNVDVATGGAIIKSSRYKNGALKTVTIEDAHVTYDRYDLIVVQRTLNAPSSTIIVTVHKGTNAAAGSAVAPDPTQTSAVWEIVLAKVFVQHGITAITTPLITDERDTALCGRYYPNLGGPTIDPVTGDLLLLANPTADLAADTKGARDAALAAHVPTGTIIAYTKLTTHGSGTFNLNAKTTHFDLMAIGAGAGGGGYYSNYQGAGGGSGALLRLLWYAKIASSFTYTIGMKGDGGAILTAGTDGTDTTITLDGVTYTAAHGKKGTSTSSGGAGGDGGTMPSNGDIRQAGNPGTPGINSINSPTNNGLTPGGFAIGRGGLGGYSNGTGAGFPGEDGGIYVIEYA